MQSSSLEKSPWGIPESPRGSGQSTKRTDCAATVRKGCPQTFGGVPSGAPPGPRDRGGIVTAARTNPHYGEDVDDKIVGTGCSEEYAKLQDCLDDTDKYGFEEQNSNSALHEDSLAASLLLTHLFPAVSGPLLVACCFCPWPE